MFKKKAEQNTNDEKYNQTNITIKIRRNHDGVKLTAVDALSRRPHQLHQPSFMVLSFRVILTAVVHSQDTHLEHFAFLTVM